MVKSAKRQSNKKKVLKQVVTTSHHLGKFKLFLLVILAILVVLMIVELSAFKNPKLIRDFILQFGWLAPLAVIILQVFQSMISIVPSQMTTIAAGYVFGPVVGLVYSLIGSFIGSALIFLISRKYGLRLALRFFPHRDLVHFQAFFNQKKSNALFLARVAPIFPNDLISFAAGLTKINFWKFNLVSTIGFFVQMVILSFFGSGLAEGEINVPLMVISAVVGLLFLVVIFKNKIRKIIIKDIKEVEKELTKGVKIVF